MANIKDLEKYVNYEFSSGCYTGDDYKSFQTSDVRYFSNEWYDHILIRTAENETDYRGGFNNYTTLSDLEGTAAELLNDLPF